jgi:hypothetical protein
MPVKRIIAEEWVSDNIQNRQKLYASFGIQGVDRW